MPDQQQRADTDQLVGRINIALRDLADACDAAERRAVRAEEQLAALADAATRFRDHLSRREPIRFAIADDGSCPGCDAWNTFCDALAAAGFPF